jgi:hypothetical protein
MTRGMYKFPAAPQITWSILPSSDLVLETACSSCSGFLTSAEAAIHFRPVALDNAAADCSRPLALVVSLNCYHLGWTHSLPTIAASAPSLMRFSTIV